MNQMGLQSPFMTKLSNNIMYAGNQLITLIVFGFKQSNLPVRTNQ